MGLVNGSGSWVSMGLVHGSEWVWLMGVNGLVLLRFQNFSCRTVSVGFAEKTSVFGSV